MSVSRPLLLDLCCCQGAASAGYVRAGFDVFGSDIAAQPRYPYRFLRADALEVLRRIVASCYLRRRITAVHISPPCQLHSNAWRIRANDHPDLITPARELLIATGLPWVIENVEGAPLKDPVMLCGAMFPGLNTYRHRLFESNITLTVPEHPAHIRQTVKMGRPLIRGQWYHAVGNFSNVPYVRENMGVPWMSREGIRECIPPVYAEYVGRQLLAAIM